LAACGSNPKPAEIAAPQARVVRVAGAKPPADLLRCPVAPTFDTREGGNLPAEKRESLRELMKFTDALAVQVRRFVEWHEPGKCAPKKEGAKP
jgi:hypothetical protein